MRVPVALQASRAGVLVSNIPSDGTGNARSCAEHAILLTLAALRDLSGCRMAIQERRLGEPCGETLFGKHVLVLGYGNIARGLIPLLHAFGASVTCVRRSPWEEEGQVRASRGVPCMAGCADGSAQLLP